MLSYADFKEWMENKYPQFKELDQSKILIKGSNETFRFEYKQKDKCITIHNATSYTEKHYNEQYLSFDVETSKTSGYGCWIFTLQELDERIKEELSKW